MPKSKVLLNEMRMDFNFNTWLAIQEWMKIRIRRIKDFLPEFDEEALWRVQEDKEGLTLFYDNKKYKFEKILLNLDDSDYEIVKSDITFSKVINY